MRLSTRLQKLGTETAFAVSARAAQWQAQGNKIYPFHLGDINLPTPANIVEATKKAIADGYTGYCPGAGIVELRDVIAADVGRKRNVSYNAENVSIQPGGKPVIGKFIAAVMNPGDEVLYPNPGYPIYESQIEFQGGVAVPYGYQEAGGAFYLDLDKLKASITDKTCALIYNNYQNPTGAQSTRTEMEALAQLAIEHDLWVLSDDAYFEIQYRDTPLSIVNIPGMQERTVILYTCSKRFAMTGWRLGAAIGPQAVIDVFNKLNINAESCTSHFIQRAMVEAIGGDSGGPNNILKTLRQRRDQAVAGLNAIEGIVVQAPQSTFYLFPNVSHILQKKGFTDVNQLMEESLTHANVSFCTRHHFGRLRADKVQGTDLQTHGEKSHYIRFAYSGIAVDDIKVGMEKLKRYFES